MASPISNVLSSTLRLKLRIVTACLAAGIVLICFVAIYFPSAQLGAVDASLNNRAQSYSRIAASQLQSAVAFDDHETAREVFDSLATDPSILSAAIYRQSGRLLEARGSSAVRRVEWSEQTRTEVRSDRVIVFSPVVPQEGPRGTLVLELSRAEANAQRHSVQLTASLIGLLALLIAGASAWSIATSMSLGQTVQRRTDELDQRNDAMRLVLDNASQGFMTVDRNGSLAAERSKIVDRWFGQLTPGTKLWNYLRSSDGRAADWIEVGWDALNDGSLPLELVLDQLPKSLVVGTTRFEVEYKPVSENETLSKMILVVSDVTARHQQQQLESQQREFIGVFQSVMRDQTGFLEFHADADALVKRASSGEETDRAEVLRLWHTLKGNCGLYGLTSVVEVCHQVESRILKDESLPTDAERQLLSARWIEFAARLRTITDRKTGEWIEISALEHRFVIDALTRGNARRETVQTVESWVDEPTHKRMSRLGEQAKGLAHRLEKGAIDVRIESNQMRLSHDRWAPIWTALGHALRNAVDHGLESNTERSSAGKSPAGSIVLRTKQSPTDTVIEVSDDGRGIDWDALAVRAESAGMAHAVHEDLIEVLFALGVSTRAEVTDVSGRGVGMNALRSAAREMGGTIEVESQRGRGTTIRVRVPMHGDADAKTPTPTVTTVRESRGAQA